MTAATEVYRRERVHPTVAQLSGWVVDHRNGSPESASGRCPHCTHTCSSAIVTEVADVALAAADAPPATTLTRTVICNCTGAETRPDGVRQGCGRWWLAQYVFDEDTASYSVRPAPDDSLLGAAQALESAMSSELADVRAAAEKWLGGITALYGLFGLAGLTVGKEGVGALGGTGRVLATVAVVTGLVLAGGALQRGYRAAYGWPQVWQVNTDEQLREWHDARSQYGPKAAKALGQAVAAAAGSLAALVVATGLVWFWPSDAPRPLVRVQWTDDSRTCGTLLDTTRAGAVRVRSVEGDVTSRQARSISTITAVDSCP